MFDVIVPPW